MEQKTEMLMLRVTPTLKAACEAVAERGGMTLSDWARAVLARAVHEGAFAPRRGTGHERSKRRRV